MPEESFVTSRLIVSHDAENLFIKLTPDVLAKLLSNCDSGGTEGADPARWSVQNGHARSFLPLAITIPGFTVYASFNGGLLSEDTGESNMFASVDLRFCKRACDESVFYVSF